jgi:hypothetical protein
VSERRGGEGRDGEGRDGKTRERERDGGSEGEMLQKRRTLIF